MSINKENVKDIKLIDKIIDGSQNIAFDNTISGLSATNLKGALDEVAALASTPDVLTTLTLVGNVLTYLDEHGVQHNIDLGQYLDNTDKFLVSGSVSGSTLSLQLNDSSIINIDVQSLLDNTDKFVVSGSVSQDTLTLVLNDSSTVNVDISGIQNTTVDTTQIQFDLTGPSSPLTEGGLAWNPDEQTLDLVLNGATLQVGQEQLILVRNNLTTTIPNGTVLMATGAIGNSGRITVAPHNGLAAYSRFIVGVATEDIPAGADGFATTFGKVRQLSTNGSLYGETWVDGTVLYVKPNDSGHLTAIEPTDSEVKMPIAFVLNAHATNGQIFVRVLPFDENHFISHTQMMINDAITALINSAPGALDTLNELAAALGNDANFATSVTNALALKANASDVNSALALKADQSTTYNKTEVDTLIQQAKGMSIAMSIALG